MSKSKKKRANKPRLSNISEVLEAHACHSSPIAEYINEAEEFRSAGKMITFNTPLKPRNPFLSPEEQKEGYQNILKSALAALTEQDKIFDKLVEHVKFFRGKLRRSIKANIVDDSDNAATEEVPYDAIELEDYFEGAIDAMAIANFKAMRVAMANLTHAVQESNAALEAVWAQIDAVKYAGYEQWHQNEKPVWVSKEDVRILSYRDLDMLEKDRKMAKRPTA